MRIRGCARLLTFIRTHTPQASEAEKNFLAKQEGVDPATGEKVTKEKKPDRLYVGNLHVGVMEHDLQSIFTPFGDVEGVTIVRDEVGNSKGYGFVKFARVEDAKTALEKMPPGLELLGKVTGGLAGALAWRLPLAPTPTPSPDPNLDPNPEPNLNPDFDPNA